jgi:Flp pilus assembly protein TadD
MIEADPGDAAGYVLLGQVEEGRGSSKKAEELYRKALHVQPNHPQAANNLAYILLERGGNVDEAVSLAQVARAAAPDSPTTADTLAWAYYHKGAYGLAVGLLKDAIKKSPQSPVLHYHLGLAYQKSGERGLARSHLERVLQLKADYEHAPEVKRALRELGG